MTDFSFYHVVLDNIKNGNLFFSIIALFFSLTLIVWFFVVNSLRSMTYYFFLFFAVSEVFGSVGNIILTQYKDNAVQLFFMGKQKCPDIRLHLSGSLHIINRLPGRSKAYRILHIFLSGKGFSPDKTFVCHVLSLCQRKDPFHTFR